MIALLLRFYPARWRARYGDEFEALLVERPLGPFDVADVLLGALDAQLHLRGLGAASQHGRGFAMSLRIGGYAAIGGGALWFIVFVGSAANGSGDGPWWAGFVILGATLALLVALVGLSAFQARRYPRLVWTAFIVPAVGACVSIVGMLGMAAIGDRPFIGGFSPWQVWMLGVIGLLVGSGLFALATWRVRTLSRGAAALLGAGTIAIVPALAGLTGGFAPSPLGELVTLASMAAFAGGWIALGVSALRTTRTVSVPVAGAPA